MQWIVRQMLLPAAALLLPGPAALAAQSQAQSPAQSAAQSVDQSAPQSPAQSEPQAGTTEPVLQDAQPGPASTSPGQGPGQDQEPAVAIDATTAAALEGLAAVLREKREQRAAALERQDGKAALALAEEIQQLRWQFAGLASEIDVQAFEQPSRTAFDPQAEIEELIRPVLRLLKEATVGPRKEAELEARLEQVTKRRQLAIAATERLRRTASALAPDSAARAEAERELREHWQPLLNELGSEILVLNANLERLVVARQPLLTRMAAKAQGFLEKSGLTLLLAALVFVAVFFGLRFVFDQLLRYQRHRRGFSMRLTEVLLRISTVLLAVIAMLIVPYAREDWLLQAIAIIFLIGAGWVAIKMAPQFFEQFRLILNIGSVREGERILIEGLPFRVDALRFYSRLVNPELTGGVLRVPINDLIGQRSRPVGSDEPWFPCRIGDIVALADGVVGKVQLQTPEVVIVAERKDAPRSYQTTAFLQQKPRNLSNGFEIVVRFGIDYGHQADSVTAVPAALQRAVSSGLEASVGSDELHHVLVELTAAGSSSLDFLCICVFAGAVASRYHELDRRVNALLVAACTEHGFGIPFPQLTVHGVDGRPAAG